MRSIRFKIVLVLLSLHLVWNSAAQPSSIYQFTASSIDGQTVDFSSFKGKKLLIVNTASRCGFTPQFRQLQELYEKYKDKGFMIIGFPSNDFANEEPGNNQEIQSFCQKNYGVTFLMMEKTRVKGDSMHPVYKWLTSRSQNGVKSSKVRWNFQKYRIDENGQLVGIVSTFRKPDCRKIRRWLKKE